MKRNIDHFAGCLLGGALGDALGSPVELCTYEEITRDFGDGGVLELKCNKDGCAQITDDTQLTLFTAEGLLRAKSRSEKKELPRDLRETTNVVFRAYLRWLYTQGLYTTNWKAEDYDGWLVGVRAMYVGKQASTISITTLGKGIMGRLSKPINDSKNCGGVIRVSPVGLFERNKDAFELGTRIGAITHGHPSSYYSAGSMALIISNIIEGMSIMDAVFDVIAELKRRENTDECIKALESAIDLYKTKPQSQEAIGQLGAGREATQALAMGVYCALSFPDDIIGALRLAVNQDGDSGSVASIAGSIVGANIGQNLVPKEWIQKLQLAHELETMAEDLYIRHREDASWIKRYPSW